MDDDASDRPDISGDAGVNNVEDNERASRELERVFDKALFSRGKICGQFNLGFIIAKFNNDLFIIDQHAADEKYNFETLQKSTKKYTNRISFSHFL